MLLVWFLGRCVVKNLVECAVVLNRLTLRVQELSDWLSPLFPAYAVVHHGVLAQLEWRYCAQSFRNEVIIIPPYTST
jgi:hypothetical protein